MSINIEFDTRLIIEIILVIIAFLALVLHYFDHIKDDRNERSRIQEFYYDIENLIYFYYQEEIMNDFVKKIKDIFKRLEKEELLPKLLEGYKDQHAYYKLKVQQNIQDYRHFLGLVVTGKQKKKKYLNDAYIIVKDTGELIKRSGERIIQDYSEIKDEEIKDVDGFLQRLRDYWNIHYWKRFRGKIKKRRDPHKDLKDFIDGINEGIEPITIIDYVEKGNLFYYKKEYIKAIECYDKALEVNPKLIDVLANKGAVFDELDEHKKAIELYDKALEINPKHTNSLTNKGVALEGLGKYEKAIEFYDKALKIDPKLTNALINKGNAFAKLGEYEKAIKFYDKALEIDPEHDFALTFKGVAFMDLKEYEKAIELYDKVLEIDPKHFYALVNKGITFAKLGENEKAIELYNKALEIDPKHIDTMIYKGEVFADLEEYKKAIELYDRALEIDPKHIDALVNKGEVFADLEEYEKAIELYDKALEIDPEHFYALTNKCIAFVKLNKIEKAIDLFEVIALHVPNGAKKCYNVAREESLRENKLGALFLLGQAINLDYNLKNLAKEEKDFDNIREEEGFRRLIED